MDSSIDRVFDESDITLNEEKHIYTVSELTSEIKNMLEKGFPYLWIEGEISNFKKPSSGHIYFTLKDMNCQIQGIMYRSSVARLPFAVEDGMKVLVFGKVTVYERGGQYQIMAQLMEPRGMGALQLAFEQLKRKLYEEGLFDKSKKKPVPLLPDCIGVVTSPTGAAIRDILNVINRRFSNIHLIINPVRVQGEEAPGEISCAIDEFNRLKCVDVILVTRGGGSIEDLWSFNTEIVARSIFRSEIPVISAVGHEIDWTISDFVADLRVPTPSAAAELVVASETELKDRIKHFEKVLTINISHMVSNLQNKLLRLSKSPVFTEPINRIRQFQQQVDELEADLIQLTKQKLQILTHNLLVLTEKLHAFSPSSVLLRGFSITTQKDSNIIIKSVNDVKTGDEIKTRLYDGIIVSKVDNVTHEKNNIFENQSNI